MSIHHQTTAIAAKHWPEAPKHRGKRQAVRLIRAKAYLKARGIEAFASKSTFEYQPVGAAVLKVAA